MNSRPFFGFSNIVYAKMTLYNKYSLKYNIILSVLVGMVYDYYHF